MKATINGRNIIFTKSGDKYYPVSLFVDDIFINKYETFEDAEIEAERIVSKYPTTK